MIVPGSYANGFAPRDGMPRYPSLWKGCVGAWAPCLGPSGLTLYDWSGNKNHGTLVNTTLSSVWSPVGGQYALALDGTNDRVEMGNASSLRASGAALTLSGWVWDDGVTRATGYMMGKVVSTHTYYLFIDQPSQAITFNTNTTSGLVGTFGPGGGGGLNFMKNRWNHVAGTYDGTTLTAYVNGKAVATVAQTGTIVSNSDGFALGDRGATTFSPLNVPTDDQRVYTRCLTPAEIICLSLRRGIAYELADTPQFFASSAPTSSRRRRILTGSY